MKVRKEDEISFEYRPLETEMGNYNEDNSEELANDLIRFSQLDDEAEDESVIDNYNNDNDNDNGYIEDNSIQSLQSLRISCQSSDKRDNEKTLLERINMFHLIERKEEMVFTPQNCKSNNNNRILITDPFDVSNANTKNINAKVSELDTHANASHKNTIPNNRECTESTLQHTITGDNKSNTIKDYSSSKEGQRLIAHDAITHMSNKTDNQAFLIKSKVSCKRNKKNKKPNKYESEERPKRDTESLSKTIYDIIHKINQKHIGAVLKMKTVALKEKVDVKASNAHKAAKRINGNIIKNHNQFSNNKNNTADALRNSIHSKVSQQKQLKPNYRESSLPKSHLICTKIDPLLSSKLISQTSKHSTEQKTMIKINENEKLEKNSLSFNYAIFHTIQSIQNQKVKNSLLNTLSKKKVTSQANNNAFKKHGFNKGKGMNFKSSLESKALIKQIHTHIDKSNNNDKGNKMHYNHTFQMINKTMQLNTPINMKPHKDIYKASNNKIATTPMNGLKIKIRQYDNNRNANFKANKEKQ